MEVKSIWILQKRTFVPAAAKPTLRSLSVLMPYLPQKGVVMSVLATPYIEAELSASSCRQDKSFTFMPIRGASEIAEGKLQR